MRTRIVMLTAVWSITCALSAQDPAPPLPKEPAAPQQPAAEPTLPAPRVVGQAQSQEELDAFTLIQQTTDPEEFVRLSEAFLQQYPGSGLTPFVHYNLSTAHRRNNDPQNFILHGEKALEELPNLADVLAYLAFFYSEQGNGARARECAQRAMEVLNTMSKPDQLSARTWASQKFALNAEAHYALGRVALTDSMNSSPPSSDLLENAVTHLEKSLEQAPDHSYAAFRLAEAYTRQESYEKAVSAYARSVAIGGAIAEYARPSLQKVYEHVHGNSEGMEEAIAEEKQVLAQKLGERQQLLDQIAEEERQAQENLETPVVRPPL